MDLSVEAEAFGSPIRFSDKEVPAVTAAIVSDNEMAEELKIPKVGDGRTSVYIETAKLLAENIKDRPTFGGIIGPFSLAGRLMDMTEIMIQALIDPDMVNTVLDKCTNFLVEYAKAFKDAGVNGLIIAEPASGLLSPEMCTEFSSVYVKRIVEAVQDENFYVILHNCGNSTKQVTSMLSTGAMGLHFGNAVDMMDILPQMPNDRLAFGNIEPAGVFKNGTIENMQAKVADLLRRTTSYSNFVLSSGCDIPPGTSLNNVDAFFNTLSEYNGDSSKSTKELNFRDKVNVNTKTKTA
jgi:uroporphyrinogen decarboxylase